MGGKSTYMRQAALIVILAGIGSYVPADSARIGPIDRVFTRIGAADDLAGGRSTFMVEMTEAANILNNATRDSLVLMDEIGRGTSTYDGLSLAWACARHLGREIGAFTLFATHYFELTALAEELPACANVHLDATEHGDQLVFLHAVKEGPANQSYGLQVARLAGVPRTVITEARRYLQELERRDHATRPPTPQQELLLAPPQNETESALRRMLARGGSGIAQPARRARRALSPEGIAGRRRILIVRAPRGSAHLKSKAAPKGRLLFRWLPATRALGLGLRFVHLERTSVHLEPVEVLDGAGGLGVRRHLDEAETTGTAGVAIVDQRDGVDGAVGGEQGADGVLVGGERQVANVNLAHLKILSVRAGSSCLAQAWRRRGPGKQGMRQRD